VLSLPRIGPQARRGRGSIGVVSNVNECARALGIAPGQRLGEVLLRQVRG
jgi:hypothetical protein